MRLKTTYSKNAKHYSIIKDIDNNGKRTTAIVEILGNDDQVKARAGTQDPMEWIEDYIKRLNKLEKDENRVVSLNLNPKKEITKDKQLSYNAGYLFLQKIYYKLGIKHICSDISEKYKFAYDLNSILSNLIYSRIIYPTSKLGTYQLSKNFLEQPNFELQHIYRSLEIIAKENDYIQSELYKNSLKYSKRNDAVLYYDCTNFFFEIEQEEGLKQYGHGKQHQPTPIVEMGLFMDSDGIPLAMSIHPGNTNEQITLKPLEEKILKDFGMSKFVVCTDAGLASIANRKFNNQKNRAFITTQSIKKLKGFLKDWALDNKGWKLTGSSKTYDISELEETEENQNKHFYKERWINENDLEQRLIVTYSIKYRNYQRNIRSEQIARAQKLVATNPGKVGKVRQNDYKRFISKIDVTTNGELAEETIYSLDKNLICEEEKYDGFYGVCTNLEDEAARIIEITRKRWEIEECFRLLKSEFKTRPVYLSRDDRIIAHFITCFLAIVVYRYLEHELDEAFTASQIIKTLRGYNVREFFGDGYVPTYTRTDIVDLLHNKFDFRTDFEIVSYKKMKNIFKSTRK